MRDLSELGLRCTAPQRLAPRTELEVAFALPGRADLLRLRARTVRCVAAAATGSEFTVGLKFVEVPPLMRAAILGYVAKGKRAP